MFLYNLLASLNSNKFSVLGSSDSQFGSGSNTTLCVYVHMCVCVCVRCLIQGGSSPEPLCTIFKIRSREAAYQGVARFYRGNTEKVLGIVPHTIP